MTPNLVILILIVTALVFLLIGIYIGFILSYYQDKKLRNKVDSMDVSEIFKRHHGISD